MSTKYRFRDKYRIQLREKDHPPPHVHLTGGGVDVMLCLETVRVMARAAPPLSARSISRYSSGREAVPRSLALACLGWESLQPARGLKAAEETGRYTVTRKP